MTEALKARLQAVYAYLREQLTETTTIRGVVVALTMAGGVWAHYPVESVTAFAVLLGAVLKILLPDRLP